MQRKENQGESLVHRFSFPIVQKETKNQPHFSQDERHGGTEKKERDGEKRR